jgi:hypothetical protein
MNLIRTPEKIVAFCAALAETCNVGKACTAVGIGRRTAYDWRRDDKQFAQMWDEAMKVGVSALEDEAHRRAFEGVDKPLVHKGEFTYLYEEERDAEGNVVIDELTKTPKYRRKVGPNGEHVVATMKEYSDTLAIFLLKAHDPDKYRERSDVNVKGELTVNGLSGRMRNRAPLA